ncbi:MAG TPA: heavy metal translocating P-type ATPase [Roseiflexaceae bacterium]|nr:heavy metal translocating P-type ATPase [Roseiflexaceae bacterium]
MSTITLRLPAALPEGGRECCRSRLVAALRARDGVLDAHPEAGTLLVEIDPGRIAAGDCERLARDTGELIAQRYEHQTLAVTADPRPAAALLARIVGVQQAMPDQAAATIRLEYDREQVALETILEYAAARGHQLAVQGEAAAFVCGVEGMCCSAETGPIERAVRALPGVRSVFADATMARLTVDYDPQALAPERIVAQVQRLGFSVTAQNAVHTTHESHSHQHDVSTETAPGSRFSLLGPFLSARDLLTALCALLIAGSWVAEFLSAQGLADGLNIAATLVGGVFVARAGLARLWATRSFDINMLMTIAAVGALVLGDYAEAAAVVGLFALGNALESYTMRRARRSIGALAKLMPENALALRGGQAQEVRADSVVAGELILVRPGERIPLDGAVQGGESAVDQAPITGESMPVPKATGDPVFAGTINGAGALEVRVTRPASDSTLARVIRLVEQSQAHKAPTQRFVDRFAAVYTPAVLVLAVLIAVVPPLALGGTWGEWVARALTLLVIACPCALVISTPVSIVSAISAGARRGVLFKGGAALEAAAGLRAIAFDKTGTLTAGRPAVVDVIHEGHEEREWAGEQVRVGERQQTCTSACSCSEALHQAQDNDSAQQRDTHNAASHDAHQRHSTFVSLVPFVDHLLAQAAAVERQATHPLARAIVRAAEERGLEIPKASGARQIGGRGARALVAGREVVVGSRALFGALVPALEQRVAEAEAAGATVALVGWGDRARGAITLADTVRPESRGVVAALRGAGVARIVMLTGDHRAAAERVALATGVDEARAGLLPEDKLAAVDDLLARHGAVAMVGDGVNDAPALARATLGIAMGAAGSHAALEAADVALLADDLDQLPFAMRLSRSARRIITQNVVFALAIKALFLGAAVLGVATLWMAVLADTGAALIVILNGMRLLREKGEGRSEK